MTKFSRFQRGSHTYTRVGKSVTVERTSGDAVPQPVEYEFEPDCAEDYVNAEAVNFSESKISVAFADFLPGMPVPAIKRIISLEPQTAKLLARALKENIAGFEEQYGGISLPGQDD